MGAQFRKFVEFCTDSRYVPMGARCALCRKKMGFFCTGFWSVNAAKLADGVICGACAEKVKRLLANKRKWMTAKALREAPFGAYNTRNRDTMPVQAAQALLDAKEAAIDAQLAAMGGLKALFCIEDAVQIAPTALQVGVKRAKQLEDKIVVYGTAERGEMGRADEVLVEQDGALVKCTVLEAYVHDCEENTLDVQLKAHTGRQKLCENETGWLVLDYERCVESGAYIGR